MDQAAARFSIIPMSEADAITISQWRYDAPYTMYNWDSWHLMVRNQYEIANPIIREQQYRSVICEQLGLCGFAQFFPMLGVTRLGLGLRPDLCDQGLGAAFVSAIAKAALIHAPQCELDLEVITHNVRAIKAYIKAGFSITDTYERMTAYGIQKFHCMVYEQS